MSFESLGLTAPILKALNDCAYRQPTPIQKQAIPPALEGKDVLGCAQTGTGKTCAFGTPILQRLSANPTREKAVRALILTPTRELALQIQENMEAYAKKLPLRTAVIFGGVGQTPQVERLKRGVDVLTATPGRLLDLQNQGLIDLSHVEIFVLDEADRMLDMGFIHDVRKIIALLPKKKQTLFFSATMPEEITDLVDTLMKDPVRVAVNPISSPVEVIRQQVYLLDRKNKTQLLAQIIRDEKVKNALVFTRTKHGADKVTRELIREGIGAAAIHGNKSQTARQQALSEFKKGKVQVLVATDIAARGLDIEELSHVFNYNLPEVPETYVHRIGRTGRAGRGGTAISFCDHSEEALLRSIEALLGTRIPRVDGHPFPMEVFEVPRRDSKGRVIHPDDEEARQAAREKRAEKKLIQKQADGKKDYKPTGGQPKAESKKRPRAAQPVSGAGEPMISRNPLEGEKIMDATARLLASKPLRKPKPSVTSDAAARETKPSGRKPIGKGQKMSKEEAASKAKKPAQENRRQRQKPKQEGKKRLGTGENASASTAASERKEQKHTLLRQEAKGRGSRRRIPFVEGPRSRQKDSTEQPSLMKPFYIEHD